MKTWPLVVTLLIAGIRLQQLHDELFLWAVCYTVVALYLAGSLLVAFSTAFERHEQ